MGKDKDFPLFSCVVYSHLKAFGKKQENKNHRKISHSTVSTSVNMNLLTN